jgi:ATP-binding cassette, subfamily B, bacterial HlyB/CyaB
MANEGGAVAQAADDMARADRGDGAAADPLPALCLIARLHHVAAEPAALRHQLGKSASDALGVDDLLLCARHLGLKARRSPSSIDRLALVPLPALAFLADGRCVVLAQCDGQRCCSRTRMRKAADPRSSRSRSSPRSGAASWCW